MSQDLSFPFSDILTTDQQSEILRDIPLNSDQMQAFLNGDNNFQLDEPIELEDFKQDFSSHLQPQGNLAHHEQVSLNPSNVLSNEEYTGPFEFEVSVIPNHKSKNPWVFSATLNKVFMDMNQHFPVDFKVRNRPNENLFVRVTPQYSLPQHASEPVYRCIQHDFHADPSNVGVQEDVRQHVLRCANDKSLYVGRRQENHRLSILFPFAYPQIGSDSVREMFYFVCKSSCPTPGMNRRAIEVIFTLENNSGIILGRKCLHVRICACPKRDKEKEEKEYQKEKFNSTGPPRGKKRKVDNTQHNHSGSVSSGKVVPTGKTVGAEVDTTSYTVNITGKQNLIKVLNVAEDALKAQILDLSKTGQNDIPFQKNLHEIQALKRKFH